MGYVIEKIIEKILEWSLTVVVVVVGLLLVTFVCVKAVRGILQESMDIYIITKTVQSDAVNKDTKQ